MLTNYNIFRVELKLATNIRLLSDEQLSFLILWGKKPLPDSSDGGLSLLEQKD